MRTLLVALVLVSLFSCNRNVLRLEYTNAKGEVPQLGNLVFRFNNTIAADSLLNEWDSTQYVSFKPSIPGRFRWDAPDQLVFSPSRPLPPSTSFEAELTDEIIAGAKFTDVDADGKIVFSTPFLQLQDVNVTWASQEGSSKTAYPSLDLFFNYPVAPATLNGKLQVKVEGKPVEYDLITLSEASRISVRLKNILPRDQDMAGDILIQKGVVPNGGKNGTDKEISAAYTISSPFNLVVNDISAQHDGLTGTVIVTTSQRLASGDINNLVSFSPAVKFSVEATDEGFNIKSDGFDAEQAYTLTLRKGIRGNVGGVLQEEYDNNVAFGELEPSVIISGSKGIYLSALGTKMLELKVINVPKIKLVISKIYESNLLTAGNYGYEPREIGRRDENVYDDGYYSSSLAMGDIIYEKEIETSSLPKMGNSRLFKFDIEDRLPSFKGIYHIRVRSSQNYWISDSRFVSVSDIGLIAREGRDKMFVFANSIKSTMAIAGVNVIAYGNNNQVLGMGSTNDDGVAEITYARKEFAGFKPAMIIAKTENDFNYLPFNTTRVNTSRFETGGKRINTSALDAFIYGERDIYRPGERINFSIIVRDPAWKVPAQVPVKFRFLYPDGKEMKSFRKTLNEQGAAEGQLDINSAAITGTYTLEAYSSNDILIGTSLFNVEEFVPDRIKVTASLDKKYFTPGEKANLSLNAVNFFGPAASGRNYEAEIQLKPKDFSPKKYSNYTFEFGNRGLSMEKVVRQGKLDNDGNALEVYEVPPMFRNNGILQADFYTTVFDETGRPVSRSVSADVFTQPVYFGIGDDGYWYYALNQPVKFPVIALNREERVTNVKANVKVIRKEYKTVLTKAGGYFRYESQQQEKIISNQEINVSGENTTFSFVPRAPGNYEIRISIPGSSGYVARKFYSYGSWGGDANSFEVNTDGNIDIEADRSIYNAGETGKLLFKTPFNGRLLVTIEQDKMLSYRYVDVVNRSAAIEMPFDATHLPNVFVTATLIKAHSISEIPLTVAHGFMSIRVEEKKRKNVVEIRAAKAARSNTMQEVIVQATPGSYVTLAAVDNGVLQVSDFKTPDPYQYFYANRALQVNAYDMYPLLFPELRARLSSTGGDGDLAMQKRVNPMPAKRVRILSYWSGMSTTNGNGQVKFRFSIPKFSGQVRLMAVAYKNESFGSAESVMTVSDPLVLSMGLPRFLSPGDSISVPVTITNTLPAYVDATASLKVTGPLSVSGPPTRKISLAGNKEVRADFSIVAGTRIDTANVMIDVVAGGQKYSDVISIGIRPSAPLQKQFLSGMIAGGTSKNIATPINDFLPGSSRYSVVVSKNPVLEIGEQLRFLVQYPYGCTEQVISSAFPQLYYGDLAVQFARGKGGVENANQNVIQAINLVKLRQLYNGALAMWDNEGSESWWTSAYGAHFLIEAKKAGFAVDESLLNTMLNYLNNRLRNKSTILYTYNRNQNKKIAPKEVAYSLYVLSLASRANVSAMNYYKANTAMLSLDSKYLLSAAYAVAGDRKKFADMLPDAFAGDVSVPETGGSFYSPLRDEAIALSALMDVDPDNKQIPVMAKHVADELKSRTWYSTQECAFSFLALGKLAKRAGQGNATADLKSNGKTVAAFTGNELRYSSSAAIDNLQITAKGNGRLYYFIESEGISSSGKYKEEDSYIKVRKQFFDRFGKKMIGNVFKRNELVIVQISVERMFDTDVQNIAVTDMLPAGFEIENPRTKEVPGMDWIKDASVPTALDVRDDRINLFIDLTANRQVYYYAARAISPGVYQMGPVAADAMYNGEYHSYHGAATIKINE